MRKLFSLVLALALVMSLASVVLADAPVYPNTIWVGGHGEPNQQMSEVIRVRSSKEGPSITKIASGAAVVWDTASADGVTVTECLANGDMRFAGIAVTDLLTQDAGETGTRDIKDDRYGYICIRGYALASIDAAITASSSTTMLAPSITGGLIDKGTIGSATSPSRDCAILLGTVTAASANRPTGKVWVR